MSREPSRTTPVILGNWVGMQNGDRGGVGLGGKWMMSSLDREFIPGPIQLSRPPPSCTARNHLLQPAPGRTEGAETSHIADGWGALRQEGPIRP